MVLILQGNLSTGTTSSPITKDVEDYSVGNETVINNYLNYVTFFNTYFYNLILCNNGTYNIISNLYPNWENFKNKLDENDKQLIYDSNSKGFIILNNKNGNQIKSLKIINFWNIVDQLTYNIIHYQVPNIDTNYYFITLKIELNNNVIYNDNIIQISVFSYEGVDSYRKLKLGDEFIMYMCEFNSFYNKNNSGFEGRTAWLNASKLYDPLSYKYTAGGGCYNYQTPKYPGLKIYDYEIYVPNLVSQSSTAIYLKIGLPEGSNNNIAKVIHTLDTSSF